MIWWGLVYYICMHVCVSVGNEVYSTSSETTYGIKHPENAGHSNDAVGRSTPNNMKQLYISNWI